ncbi:MAG TPA: hypothetical protein VK904_06865 [Miltoncostaeaceae bacterium]|nr:hypothetical protein [Miltoncostaeaceae bacterium]
MAKGAEGSGSRLPRRPHADKPRPDEKVLKCSGADLQNGWLARHGDLSLTEERLVFVPTLLDTALMAKRREIPLDSIRVIERFPLSAGMMPRGGRRPRMLLHTDECVYEFMVGDLDAWIDLLERFFQLRQRQGEGDPPAIKREGHLNPLLMEE